MGDFTLERAIINEGKHLTKGTRDRYINHTTQGLLSKEKKHGIRETIWRNIQRHPENPRYAITEDFVWSLFGGAETTSPIDFDTQSDVRTFCVWLQHSETLRAWFSAVLDGEIVDDELANWEPDREEIKFSKEINTGNFHKSHDTIKKFAKEHDYELMEYAPRYFAERAFQIIEEVGEDFVPTEKEAADISKALSSKAVHPFIDLDENIITNLLQSDDHNCHIEIFVATNWSWVSTVQEAEWIDEESHKYLHCAIDLETSLEEAQPIDLIDDGVNELQSYFLAVNHWEEISPEAQIGRVRSWFHSMFGWFSNAYNEAEERLNDNSVVLSIKLAYEKKYNKTPTESFNSYLLQKIEKDHLQELIDDENSLADVVLGIGDKKTLLRLDRMGNFLGSLVDDSETFNSEVDDKSGVLSGHNITSRHSKVGSSKQGGATTGKSKINTKFSTSEETSETSSVSKQTEKLKTPRYEVGQSPFSKKATGNPTTNNELTRGYVKKAGFRKLAFDANSSWVGSDKGLPETSESESESGLADESQGRKLATERLKQLFLQGQTTQFLKKLFSKHKKEREFAKSNMLKSIKAAKKGANTIESPLVLVLREGSIDDKNFCRKHIKRLNLLLEEDLIYEEIQGQGQLYNLFSLKLPKEEGEESSVDVFFQDGEPEKLLDLLHAHSEALKENIFNNAEQSDAASIIREKIVNISLFKSIQRNIGLLLLIYDLDTGEANKKHQSTLFQKMISREDIEDVLIDWVRSDKTCDLLDAILQADKARGLKIIDALVEKKGDDKISSKLKAKLFLRLCENESIDEIKDDSFIFEALQVSSSWDSEKVQSVFINEPAYLIRLLSSETYRDKIVESENAIDNLAKLMEDNRIRIALSQCDNTILKWLIEDRNFLCQEMDVVGMVLSLTVDKDADKFSSKFKTVIDLLKDDDIHNDMLLQSVVCDNLLEFFDEGKISKDDILVLIERRDSDSADVEGENERAVQKLTSALNENTSILRLVIKLAKDNDSVMLWLPKLRDQISKYLNELDESEVDDIDDDDIVTLFNICKNSIDEALFTNIHLAEKVVRNISSLDRVELLPSKIHVLFKLLANGKALHLLTEENFDAMALDLRCKVHLFSDMESNGQRIYALWQKAFLSGDEAEEKDTEFNEGLQRLFNAVGAHQLWGLLQFCNQFYPKHNYKLPDNFRYPVIELIREKHNDLTGMIFAFIQPAWFEEVFDSLDVDNAFVLLTKLTAARYERFFKGEENAANLNFLGQQIQANVQEFEPHLQVMYESYPDGILLALMLNPDLKLWVQYEDFYKTVLEDNKGDVEFMGRFEKLSETMQIGDNASSGELLAKLIHGVTEGERLEV